MSKNLDLPKHWEVKKLGKVLDIQGGSQPPKSNFLYEPKEGYVQLLQIRDFGEKGHPTFVPQKLVTKFCKKDDILIARYGASLGRIVTGLEGAYNVALAKVIDEKGVFDKRFVFYLLKTQIFQTPLAMLSRSAQNGFSKGEIADIELPLPPLPEQAAIVSKIEELLSDLENGKQQLLTAQQQLKVYRQSLLKWAFEGKLTEEWRRSRVRVPSESPTTKVQVESGFEPQLPKAGIETKGKIVPEVRFELGQLPEGWRWVKLGEVASKITDGEHITPRRTSEGFLLLSARNIQNGYLALDNVDYVPVDEYERIMKRCNPEPGDILISCSGSIGRVCRVPVNLKFVMVRSVALVKFNWGKSSSKFYEYLFQSPLLQRQIEKSKKATAQSNLFLGPIKNLEVIVCPLEEQQAIVEELESKLTVCDKIEETITTSLQQAETLRQSILKRAFEGRLV